MIQTFRKATNYADNLIDPYLTFDEVQSWTVSSGTGLAATDTQYAFNGVNSLKIQNTDPTNDIVITNSTQNTVFTRKLDNCALSFYLLKSDASFEYTGEVKIFKNAVLLDTQTFTLADTEDGAWYRFMSDTTYSFVITDVITFTFQLDGIVGHGGTSNLWIDGLMLYVADDRLDYMPPIYTLPISEPVTPTNYSITSDTDAIDGGTYYANCTTGDVTVTLPLASSNNNAEITVKRVDASGNDVIIDGNGSETIDGNTTVTITDQWNSVTVRCNGTAWFIV